MRKTPFVENEYYHIYNRGVDKRVLFQDDFDFERFIESINKFNVVNPIGSIYALHFKKREEVVETPLVEFVCYCIIPNHYHFLLRQVSENGISKFMKRLNGGYTNYFNDKYDRCGALFQGVFKSKHIDSNEYLLHLSSYINLNYKVHKLRNETPKFVKSSWDEYMSSSIKGFCNKDMILGQFNSVIEYKKFAESSLKGILDRREYGNCCDTNSVDSLLIE